MKVYHHNRMIMEIEEHLEKLQNQLQQNLQEQSLESDKIIKAIAKTDDIFKAGKEIGKRSVYWIQGYIFAIKEVLGLGNVEKEQQK